MNHGDQRVFSIWNHHKWLIIYTVSSFRFILIIHVLWICDHYIYFISFSAGADFRRQNLTSTDVKFWRLKSIPALKGLITSGVYDTYFQYPARCGYWFFLRVCLLEWMHNSCRTYRSERYIVIYKQAASDKILNSPRVLYHRKVYLFYASSTSEDTHVGTSAMANGAGVVAVRTNCLILPTAEWIGSACILVF